MGLIGGILLGCLTFLFGHIEIRLKTLDCRPKRTRCSGSLFGDGNLWMPVCRIDHSGLVQG